MMKGNRPDMHGFMRQLADATYGPGNWTYDLEGGIISKEAAAEQAKMLEAFMPKLNTTLKGVPLIVGTGGDFERDQDFQNLWRDDVPVTYFIPANYPMTLDEPLKTKYD